MVAPAPIHGGDVAAAAARWGLEPSAILDFSANINPLGPPVGAVEAARAALGMVTQYPEPFALRLRAALAERHGVPDEAVLVGNGAAEVIHLLLRQAHGRRVAVPVPGFAEYARAAAAVGAGVLGFAAGVPARAPAVAGPPAPFPAAAGLPAPFPAAAGLPAPAAALARAPGGTPALAPAPAGPPRLSPCDVLILCNPHNPTGRLVTPAEVLAVVDATAATVLVDEAFIDLTDAGEAGSVIPHVLYRPNLVVIRSLTKFYAMPGLRVGYAVARPDLVARLDAVRDPWSVSPIAQAAALAALSDREYAGRTRAWVRTERPFLAAELGKLRGYAVETPPSANFILVRAPEPAHVIQERLGPQGILIRDCRSFDGLTEHHMRLAVRTRSDNLRLLKALHS